MQQTLQHTSLMTSLRVAELRVRLLYWRNPALGGGVAAPPSVLPSAARLKNTLQLPQVRAP